jgi:hypothetical protein
MGTPGFTATSSLYRSGRIYRHGLSSLADTPEGVLPQAGKLVCGKCIRSTSNTDNVVPGCYKLCYYPGPPYTPEFEVACHDSECPPRHQPPPCCEKGCVHC